MRHILSQAVERLNVLGRREHERKEFDEVSGTYSRAAARADSSEVDYIYSTPDNQTRSHSTLITANADQ
jgi:hypothetical protein